MGLEEIIPDDGSVESGGKSGEVTREVSEKFTETIKRATTQRQKTQKDEKKAKRYDFLLAKFLVKLILMKKYDNLLDSLFKCLDIGYGTNFLLGIISLVYIPISDEIRQNLEKPKVKFNYNIINNRINFKDDEIDNNIKNRINSWIEDIELVLFIESSDIVTERIIELLSNDDNIISFIGKVFRFFFNELNIEISINKSESYGIFIIGELLKSLEKTKNKK